jgi:hypothetical protein
MFGRYADTGIANRNLCPQAVAPRFHADLSAIRDGLGCVAEDIHERLIQLVRETLDFGKLTKFLHDPDAVLQLVLQKGESTFDAFMEIDSLSFRLIEPGKILKPSHCFHDAISGELVIPADLIQDVEQRLDLVVSAALEPLADFRDGPDHDVIIAVNRSHWRIDLVRDARDQ